MVNLMPLLGQDLERLDVHGGFGQPHPSGASEAALEIADAPLDLGIFIARGSPAAGSCGCTPAPARSRGRRIARLLSSSACRMSRSTSGALSSIHASSVGPKLKLICA